MGPRRRTHFSRTLSRSAVKISPELRWIVETRSRLAGSPIHARPTWDENIRSRSRRVSSPRKRRRGARVDRIDAERDQLGKRHCIRQRTRAAMSHAATDAAATIRRERSSHVGPHERNRDAMRTVEEAIQGSQGSQGSRGARGAQSARGSQVARGANLENLEHSANQANPVEHPANHANPVESEIGKGYDETSLKSELASMKARLVVESGD